MLLVLQNFKKKTQFLKKQNITHQMITFKILSILNNCSYLPEPKDLIKYCDLYIKNKIDL